MKTILTFILALLTVSVLAIPDAEAKRMGGGSNLGRQTTMPKQAQAPAAAPAQRPGAAAPAASGASRWLGPLAGLAAGGLLAALFFGGAFEGMAAMDWILIAAMAIGAFFLFRALRRRAATGPIPAMGRMGPAGVPTGAPTGAAAGTAGYGAGSNFEPRPAPGAASAANQAPAWFDGPGFAEGAKSHYIRLQAAWDKADWADIRTYTTPALFAALQAEHRRSATEGQYTEVVTLNSELLQVQRDGDLVLASVRFSGLIREEAQGPAEAFDEVWHVQHAWASPAGDWLISGIQQVQG
ncbi:MAG TPA: Tim44-like domain-containing protein [Chromatiaceae bacterium]|nr:Tim44-like domain-containing protein [Chromatiaceae bacterium]